MACATCNKKHTLKDGYFRESALNYPPLNASDIMLFDGNEVRNLTQDDWPPNRHKLLLFYPQTFTPVCTDEMGALNQWIEPFNELDCDIYSVTAESVFMVKEFYENEEQLRDMKYKALSSFILPTRLNLMNGDHCKRATVFITKQGEVVVQEHFLKVGRNINELHRTLYAYNTDSYCGSGWNDPADGFLEKKSKNGNP